MVFYRIPADFTIESSHPWTVSSFDAIELEVTDGHNTLTGFILNQDAGENQRPAIGSIVSCWVLYNDGCFYHGTLITADNGVSLFVPDPNPYGDEIIGNEPQCMSGFDNFCRLIF